MSTTQDARKKFTIAKAQENLYSFNLANVVGAVDTQKMGTVYNPYTSKPAISDGAVSDTYNITAYTADADSLQINRRADASEHVNSYDWKSVDFGLLADRGMNMGKGISQVIDAYFLGLPVGLSGVTQLDDGDFGGTDGNAKQVTNTNIDDVINGALTELFLNDANDSKKWMALSPYEANSLRGFLQNTGNNVMDTVIREGIPSAVTKVGTTFSGVDVFSTNNVTSEAVLALATNPTDGDTITINGVVITFVDTLSGAAGEVHIAGAVDTTRANLAEFLTGTNFPGDTTEAEDTNTGYTKLSADNIAKLSRFSPTFTNSNSADTLTVRTKGTLVVSSDLTTGTNVWGTPYRFVVLGDYGSINLYLPVQGMDYVEKEVTGKPGKELYMEQFYNATVWTRMRERVVTVKVSK
jgi:hypothetical protein